MHHLVLIGDARAERGELTALASARLSAPKPSDGARARAQFSDAPPNLRRLTAARASAAARAQWRIRDPIAGTNFATKYVVQTFEQDPKEGAILYNHDNEYLHYQDDWYVLAFKEEEYVLVYYRGSNDAWDGYGGAVLYSRSKTVPQRAVPEIRAALSKVGLKWESFTATDNSCKPRESRLEEVEADLILVETKVGGGIRAAEKELEKDAIAIEKEVEKDLQAAEKEVEKDVAGFGRGFSSVLRKGR